MAARGFIGAGNIFLARYVGGVLQPYQGPYESTKFEIKPNVDLKEMISKGRDTYGQVIESVAIPQPADLTIDLAEINKESLAIAMLGTVAAVSQTAGALTDEALTDVVLDTWIPLSKYNLTGAQTVKKASTTLVNGEDYIVDKMMGWLKVLSTGSVVAGDDLTISSSYAAATGSEIKGMTDAQLRVRVRFEGKNFVDGLPVRVTIYEAVIAADSAFDFLQDDFASISLPGRMKTPTGFTEPFVITTLETVA